MSYGVQFADNGKDVSDKNSLIYNSQLDQLNVDVTAVPSHMDFFDPLQKMTNLTTTTTTPLASEVLFQVKHGMPYVPYVYLYMNVVDMPSDYAYYLGTYAVDILRLGGSLVYSDADETYFYIRHDKYHNFNMGAPTTQTETGMDLVKIRTKYLITNARFSGSVALARPF